MKERLEAIEQRVDKDRLRNAYIRGLDASIRDGVLQGALFRPDADYTAIAQEWYDAAVGVGSVIPEDSKP